MNGERKVRLLKRFYFTGDSVGFYKHLLELRRDFNWEPTAKLVTFGSTGDLHIYMVLPSGVVYTPVIEHGTWESMH